MPFRTHGISVGGLADVVHGPEGFEAGRERSPDKVVVTVRVAGVLLCGVVGAGVGGVLGRVFLLTKHREMVELYIVRRVLVT